MNVPATEQAAQIDVNVARLVLDRHVTEGRGQQGALRFGGKRYSFHDLAAIANRTGNMLKAAGVARGAMVLVILPPSPAFAATIVGAMKIGAVAALCSDVSEPAELRAVLARTNAALIVAHQDRVAAIAAAGAAKEAIVAVGQETGGYRSFIELVREQPSSLACEPMHPQAPALAIGAGETLTTFAHGQLAAGMADHSEEGPGRVFAMLRALAAGEEHTLA
jgi:acyl-coenzyme A synthetase/AMP-(fatty) acid ligase